MVGAFLISKIPVAVYSATANQNNYKVVKSWRIAAFYLKLAITQ